MNPSREVAKILKALCRHPGYTVIEDRAPGFPMKTVAAFNADDPEIEIEKTIARLKPPGANADRYFTLNGLLAPKRNDGNLGWLNAAYLDIDFDKANPVNGCAIRACRELLFDSFGLKPSVIVHSGVGFWLVFLLYDPLTGESPVRTPKTEAQWRRIQDALVAFFSQHVEKVDAGVSKRISTLARLPLSINPKSGARVVWELDRRRGRPRQYTLDDLEQALAAAMPAATAAAPTRWASLTLYKPTNPVPSIAKATGRRRGQRALALRRGRDIFKLIKLRGGRVPRGGRTYFAVMIAQTQRHVCDAGKLVRFFGQRMCTPPLTDAEIKKALDWKRTMFPRICDVTIGEWLDITASENTQLEGDYLEPRPARAPFKGQPTAQRNRRRAIALYVGQQVANGKKRPSCRNIAKSVGASCATVARDLRFMESEGASQSPMPRLY